MGYADVLKVLSLLWNIWSIRGFMILSLTIQLFLALVAPLRKKTSHSAFISIVWLAYCLADWTAIFAFGMIANTRCNKSLSEGNKDFLALWASFLLTHLGGPDTITAFTLEDNAFWFRYLVGLIGRVFGFIYLFMKMLPDKKLMAPTLLVFTTGLIKYGERIRAMYLASMKNFKDTSLETQNKDNLDHELRKVSEGFPGYNTRVGLYFFQIFKGLIVDIMPNHSQWLESRNFFLKKEAQFASEIIEIELNLLYEVFYTKIIAAYSSWGLYTRNLAYFMSITAFILFGTIKEKGLHPVDVNITYALLSGVIVLDTTSEVMLATSNWRSKKWKSLTMQILVRCVVPFLMTTLMYAIVIGLLYVCGCKSIVDLSWSSKMGSFNLLEYSFKEGCLRNGCTLSQCWHTIFDNIHKITNIKLRKIKEVFDAMKYTKKNNMDDGIWKHTFDMLKGRASGANEADRVKEIYEARGELAVPDSSRELKRYVSEFEYDYSILVWHVATEICYNTDISLDKKNQNVKFGKILSDYMMYLMVKQSDMMSAVSDIFPERYRCTCEKLKDLQKKVRAETLETFCSDVHYEYSDGIRSAHEDGDTGALEGNVGTRILMDSCSLVTILTKSESKWKIICDVWVEFLLYAAGHCRADSHARLVSEGGEFVTFVWLLMAHFGIVPRFPKA